MKNTKLIFLLFCILCASCNKNELTRDKAKELILKDHKYPYAFDWRIYCGDPDYGAKVMRTNLEEKGFVTLRRTYGWFNSGAFISLTAKAKPYLLPTPEKDKVRKIQEVKLADVNFGEITGVKKNENGKNAIVEFSTYYTNPTPFAVLIPAKDFKKADTSRVYFSLYDDGWRIEKKPGVEFMGLER